MAAIRISVAVRAAIGEATAQALETGQIDVPSAQCWWCGGAVQIAGAPDDSVALSIIVSMPITLWSHPACSDSRLVPGAEFQAAPSQTVPSPVPSIGATLIVDGEPRLQVVDE